MNTKKIGFILMFSFVVALTTSTIYAYDVTYFQSFNYTPSGCHGNSQQHLSAIVMINDLGRVVAGSKFNITVTIKGFTGSTDSVVVGLLHSQNDNALFDGPTDDIKKKITLDVNGDGATQFELTAPNAPGTYTIKATVLDGADDGSAKGFVYAESTQIVQVSTLSGFYVEYAIGAAQYLISVAIPEGGGYKWAEDNVTSPPRYKTGFLKGAAGTGNFLLDLYKATGNTTYLDYAKGAAQWLTSVAIPEGGGYKWPQRFEETNYLTGTWHGAAGIGNFFIDAYHAFGNATYLDYAKEAAQWLISVAFAEGGGYKWENFVGGGEFIRGWSRGPAGTGAFFLRIYDVTNNATYLDYAKGAAQWLTYVVIPESSGYKWIDSNFNPRNHTALGHGAAGIGRFFILAYSSRNNATYLDYAEGAAQWLSSRVISIDGGYAWLRDPDESVKQIHTTYYYGVAGVGDFYLSLATISVTIQTISHIVPWEGVDYTVVTTSNSTVGPVQFNQPQKEINFTVTGVTGTTGFVNITIPKDLIKDEPWLVLVNGIETSYQKSENTTHTFLYFTYSHSTSTVQIRGTWVVPEFPIFTILPILLIISLVAAILGKMFWLIRRKRA